MIFWKKKGFFCFLRSLLTASVVKNTLTFPVIYFIFLKNVPDQAWKSFNTKFGAQWKDPKNSYQVRQDLPLFCKLIALSLG